MSKLLIDQARLCYFVVINIKRQSKVGTHKCIKLLPEWLTKFMIENLA